MKIQSIRLNDYEEMTLNDFCERTRIKPSTVIKTLLKLLVKPYYKDFSFEYKIEETTTAAESNIKMLYSVEDWIKKHN